MQKETKEELIKRVLGIKNKLIDTADEVNDELITYIEQLSAHIIIAHCAGLTRVERNIYEDAHGQHFVQTKFGFQPSESFNKGLQIRELNHEIFKLHQTINDCNHKINELHNKCNYNETKQKSLEKLLLLNEEIRIKLLMDSYDLKARIDNLLTINKNLKAELIHNKIIHDIEISKLLNKIPQKTEIESNAIERKEYERKLIALLFEMRDVLYSDKKSAEKKVIRIREYVPRIIETISKIFSLPI